MRICGCSRLELSDLRPRISLTDICGRSSIGPRPLACREQSAPETAGTQPPLDPADSSIVVFYHVYATGDWNAVVRDQVSGSLYPGWNPDPNPDPHPAVIVTHTLTATQL